MNAFGVGKRLRIIVLAMFRVLAGISIFCLFALAQQPTSAWQEEVRRCAAAQDWTAAMSIVDREIARAPRDMDIRAWRARVLLWSGKVAEAEHEYHDILTAVPNDPDNWMALANVYSRESRTQDALEALNRAVELDPKRSDLHAARGRALRVADNRSHALRTRPGANEVEEDERNTLELTSSPVGAELFNDQGVEVAHVFLSFSVLC